MSNKPTYAELQQRILELESSEGRYKLTEEEFRLQAEIINHMTEGVYLIRTDGTIVYTNPKFEEMFGYKPGEMIGQNP